MYNYPAKSGCGSHAICQGCGTRFLGQNGKLVERAKQVIHAGTREQYLQCLWKQLRNNTSFILFIRLCIRISTAAIYRYSDIYRDMKVYRDMI